MEKNICQARNIFDSIPLVEGYRETFLYVQSNQELFSQTNEQRNVY